MDRRRFGFSVLALLTFGFVRPDRKAEAENVRFVIRDGWILNARDA
jgi:hypothetical protein